MISKEEKNIIYVRLEKGEEILSSFYEIVKKHNITSGWINGIGAICDVQIGSYNLKGKDYNKVNLEGDYELISLMGNISQKNNDPFLHLHVTLSDEKCIAYGGHLFSAKILATGEFFIKKTESMIPREYDDNIGLYLWEFKDCDK